MEKHCRGWLHKSIEFVGKVNGLVLIVDLHLFIKETTKECGLIAPRGESSEELQDVDVTMFRASC